jgi:hypothetical protein
MAKNKFACKISLQFTHFAKQFAKEKFMEKKYGVLRVIATLYKILGILIALGTILIVLLAVVGVAAGGSAMRQYGGFDGGPVVAFIGVIMLFIGGGLTALGVYAVGEGISLLVGLEENTRFTAMLLRDRFYPPQAAQPVMPPPVNPTYPPAA